MLPTSSLSKMQQTEAARLSPAERNAVSEENAHCRSSSRGAEMYSPSETPLCGL